MILKKVFEFTKTISLAGAVPITEHQYVKKVTFAQDKDVTEVVSNLNQLKTCTYNRIKIPRFDFTTEGKTIIMNIEFIEGEVLDGKKLSYFKDIMWTDLVQSDNEIAPIAYDPGNFIMQGKTLYYIDLEDIRLSSVQERTIKYNYFLAHINRK